MKSLKSVRFSDMKVGKGSIEFEKRQLGLYTILVNKHPENELYQRTQSNLLKLVEYHQGLLRVGSKPQPSALTKKKVVL